MKKIKLMMAISVLLLMGMGVDAQTSGKNSVTASWSYIAHGMPPMLEDNPRGSYLTKHQFSISYDRAVFKMFDYGLYANIGQGYFWPEETNPFIEKPLFSVGVTVKAHVLPIIEIKNNQWDLYLRGCIGGTYAGGFGLDCGIGAGVQYFPWKHIGITAEGSFGRFVLSSWGCNTKSNFQSHVGLTYRW